MTFTIPDEDRQPIDWPLIETALHDYVDDVLGIPFIFENQNVPQPAYPYASGAISAITPEGGRKELRHQFNAAADAGEEIETITCGTFSFTFSVSVHVDPKNGAYDPFCDAKMLASKLQWSLCKESALAIFETGGISVIEELAMVDSSVVVNGEWLSRYTWDVRLRGRAVVSDVTTYIDKVSGTGTLTDHPLHDFTYLYDSTA